MGLAWLFMFGAVVSSVAGAADRAAAPLRAWDGIVSATLFANIADFERDIRQEAGERVYAYLALDRTGRLALSVTVSIAPAGSRLPR